MTKPKFPSDKDLDKIMQGGKDAKKVLRKFEKKAVSTSTTGCLPIIITIILGILFWVH